MDEKFLQAWKEFNKIEKEDVELGLYRVLSLRDIEDGIAYFTVIDPVKLKFPCTLKKYSKKGLPGWALSYLLQTGLALLSEDNIFYVVSPLFQTTFIDMFGLSGKAIEPSIWRDLLLAQLFADVGFAYPTIRKRDGISCILSFHFSELNSIETNIYEIVMALGGNVIECKYDEISFQCAIKFEQYHKHGWNLALVCRDSAIGRESMTFFSAWERDGAYIYMDMLKKRHRTHATKESILSEVQELLDKTFHMPVDGKINEEKILKKTSKLLGKERSKRFRLYIAERMPFHSPEDLLSACAAFTDSMNRELEQNFRLCLGELMKEASEEKGGLENA